MPPTTSAAPPPAAPSAPSKPSAAPVPAAPPTKPSTPQVEAPRKEFMDEIGDELDSLSNQEFEPRKESPKPKAQEKPEETETEVETPEEKPVEKPSDKPVEKPIEEKQPVKVADLRKAFNELQKQVKEEYKPKLQKAEARIKELESSQPKENPETVERYKSIEQRNAALEAHIKFIDYQKSEEFNTKYQQPYIDAWQEALNDFAQLKITSEDGSVRRGTEKDLLELANMEIGDAIDKAEEKFGKSGAYAINHVREIQKLHKAQQKALADAKTNAQKIAEQNQKEGGERQKRNNDLWQQANKELVTKYPQRFGPVEGDTEGNAALSRGKAFTKLVYQDAPLTESEIALLPQSIQSDLKANEGKLSPEAMVRVNAVIANKASNHDRVVLQLNAALKELAEAKKTIEEFEASEPPGGGSQPGRKDQNGVLDDYEAEIDELDRKSRV